MAPRKKPQEFVDPAATLTIATEDPGPTAAGIMPGAVVRNEAGEIFLVVGRTEHLDSVVDDLGVAHPVVDEAGNPRVVGATLEVACLGRPTLVAEHVVVELG